MAIGRRDPGTPYLTDDTDQFMYDQHADEQAGKRRLARVHAVEHEDKQQLNQTQDLDGPQVDTPAHPYLDKQQFDGMDLKINELTTKADIENQLREQQLEMQMRLGMQPGRHFTPKPPGAM
jgi:hypothetical protein